MKTAVSALVAARGFNVGRRLAIVAACAATALALPAPAASSTRASTSGTPQARQIAKVVRATMRENDLKAVILSVRVGKREVVTRAFGNSMTGVPASTRMHFRNGNVAIAYLTTILLRLQDRGRLSADDKLSNWFPGLPAANRITLRMLANSTSGYSDYVRSDADLMRRGLTVRTLALPDEFQEHDDPHRRVVPAQGAGVVG